MSALKHSLSFPEVALGSLGQHKMLVYACSMVAMYHNYRLLFCTFMTKFISFPALVTIFNVLWGWNIIPWNSMELSLALAFSLSLSLSLQYVLLQQGLKSHLCTPQFGCKMLLNRTLTCSSQLSISSDFIYFRNNKIFTVILLWLCYIVRITVDHNGVFLAVEKHPGTRVMGPVNQ